MKIPILWFSVFLVFFSFNTDALPMNPSSDEYPIEVRDSVLRHVVLFKFKDGTTAEDVDRVQEAFVGLQSRIPEIVSLEWGVNNSPEGLDKGFTHCFFLTFRNEKDRNTYLPHPDHKAFGSLLSPFLEDVLVVDYWTTD